MTGISGERTQMTELSFGLKILQGFLKAFNGNIPNLAGHFKLVIKVSFSFEPVKRIWMVNIILGQELAGTKIDTSNPGTAEFFENPKSKLLLFDSIITSNAFSIHVEEASNDAFGFEAAAIQQDLARL